MCHMAMHVTVHIKEKQPADYVYFCAIYAVLANPGFRSDPARISNRGGNLIPIPVRLYFVQVKCNNLCSYNAISDNNYCNLRNLNLFKSPFSLCENIVSTSSMFIITHGNL